MPILILDDSFTDGYGVNDDQTFCALLEKNLGRKSHVVFNAGHGGKDIDFALANVQRHMDNLRPDIVLYCPYANDIFDNSFGSYFQVQDDSILVAKNFPQANVLKRALERSAVYDSLTSYSYAAALAKQAAIGLLVNNQHQTPNDIEEIRTWVSEYTGNVEVEHSGTGRYLQELGSYVSEKEAFFAVCYIPSIQDLVESDEIDVSRAEAVFYNLCQRFGIRFHSFTKSLRDSGLQTDELYFAEGHWTASAHRIASGDLFRLFESGFIGKG